MSRSRAPRKVWLMQFEGALVNEQGQEFAKGEKLPFDDVTVAREALGV